MQANNASLADYKEELKRGVEAGLITPAMAAALLQQYQAAVAPPSTAGSTPTTEQTIPGTSEFANLAKRVQEQQETGLPSTTLSSEAAQQFAEAEAQANAQASEAKRQRIQQLMNTMSTQAQSLVTAWQPPTMQHQAGTPPEKTTTTTTRTGGGAGSSGSAAAVKASLIKAGTILFAVLDTAVDSDYPDTPVMATIVQGPFKGAKLLGKLNLAQGQDRVSLNFSLMDRDEWPQPKSISAFAIDPDTARTVLASNVNYHYLMRYGSMFASSFLTGYANGIQSAGSTSTTGVFGTSSTHPELSAGNKIAVGLGQVGTAFSNAVASYVNTPATVKVNSGVGLGILFVSNVTE